MAELKDRVGGGLETEPGAIYPALLALVETGHVGTADRDGTRIYSLTEAGQRAAAAQRTDTRWASLTDRAEEGEERVSIVSLLDRFAEDSRLRPRLARTEQRELDRGDPCASRRRDRTNARGRRGRWMS